MSLTGNTTEAKIWNYLYSKLGNSYGVAGVMGNLNAESGLNPINLQDIYESKLNMTDTKYYTSVDNGTYTNFVYDSAGFGLAQWTWYTRKQALLNYAKSKGKSIGDLEMQLEFLMKELTESYPSILNTLKTAKSVLEASNVMLLKFESPLDQSVSIQNKRASYSMNYYNKYANSNNSNIVQTTQVTKTIVTNLTVKEQQTALYKLGYYKSNIDGIWGSQSTLATKQFQMDYGLTVDGIFGPNTEKIMLYVIAKKVLQ